MKLQDLQLEELRHGARFTARHLAPAPGAVPVIPGIDISGRTIPLNGMVGGDLITYVNFQERFCLEARIGEAARTGNREMVQALDRLERTGGILVADVSGHDFVNAMRAMMLHQAFHTGALYEMDLNGEITVRLFEQINTRFLKSRTLRDPDADREPSVFITLIYGEIESSGRFHFINAGHPLPLVFSNGYNRFVDISPDRFISYPPIGLQPGEDHADAVRYERALGYKKRYTVNEINLMGHGDILLLYSDGLLDPFSEFSRPDLEQTVSLVRGAPADEICASILEKRRAQAAASDDISLVVIKRC